MLKENCHFYTEYQDMGARIPCCTRYTQLGKCPCDNCDRFLDNVDAQKIIKKYSDGELISSGIIKEIRQEIANLVKIYPFIDHMDAYVKEDEVLEIIDKYKAESEVQDADSN